MNVTLPLIVVAAGIADAITCNYGGPYCVACAVGGILLGIAGTRLVGAEGTWPRRIGLFIATLLAPAGVLALLAWVFIPSIALPLSLLGMSCGLNAQGCGNMDMTNAPVLYSIWSIPVILMFVLAIASRVRRVPATVGVARGFTRWALPLASLLALLYALATPYRAAMHDKALFHVKQIAQNGGGGMTSTSETVSMSYSEGAPTN
jgi:hypothetical protein